MAVRSWVRYLAPGRARAGSVTIKGKSWRALYTGRIAAVARGRALIDEQVRVANNGRGCAPLSCYPITGTVYSWRATMGWSFGALGVAMLLAALGLVMNRNGRRADRERRTRGRRYNGG